ncbi:MAG TPA: 50S ribosomal protein L35 [Candidatus Krumholzibacteria bacterium]|jgi:large subunit ribosomal protein L35|nr:50S ribosomal protein L35 [Candidatus Krumholzibacteria bacterium]
MPKLKSNRAAMKRFRKTGTGKVRRNKAFKSHILTSKTTKRKRGLRKATLVHPTDMKRVRRMLLI